MEGVVEKVNSTITVELVEQKVEEVEQKVEETADKVLDIVQEKTQAAATKVEDAVEKVAKPVTDLIDKIDDDPRVKAVLDSVTGAVAEQIDGRVFSCGCFGWMFALRITRKTPQPSPSKSEVTESKQPESPLQHVEVKESPQPSPPVETQADSSPSKEVSASS